MPKRPNSSPASSSSQPPRKKLRSEEEKQAAKKRGVEKRKATRKKTIQKKINSSVKKSTVVGDSLDLTKTLKGKNPEYVLEIVKRHSYLTSLNLSENKLDAKVLPDILQVLTSATGLRQLILNQCRIDTDVMSQLIATLIFANRSNLRLSLRKNSLTESGVKELVRGFHLFDSLDLEDNKLGNRGARVIADALATNQTIKSLNLANNKILTEGAESIGVALSKNSALTCLNFSGNAITLCPIYYSGTTGLEVILDSLHRLSSQFFRYYKHNWVPSKSGLVHLDLKRCHLKGHEEAIRAVIPYCNKLLTLDVDDNELQLNIDPNATYPDSSLISLGKNLNLTAQLNRRQEIVNIIMHDFCVLHSSADYLAPSFQQILPLILAYFCHSYLYSKDLLPAIYNSFNVNRDSVTRERVNHFSIANNDEKENVLQDNIIYSRQKLLSALKYQDQQTLIFYQYPQKKLIYSSAVLLWIEELIEAIAAKKITLDVFFRNMELLKLNRILNSLRDPILIAPCEHRFSFIPGHLSVLSLAVLHNNVELVKAIALTDKSAVIHLNNAGVSPLMLAVSQNNVPMFNLLRSLGAVEKIDLTAKFFQRFKPGQNVIDHMKTLEQESSKRRLTNLLRGQGFCYSSPKQPPQSSAAADDAKKEAALKAWFTV